MIKRLFLLLLCNVALGGFSLQAQITNGSFTDGLNGWGQLGTPTAGSNTPPGSTYAHISSTNGGDGSAPVADISATLDNVILPATDIIYLPTVGQAIYQDFTVTQNETLSFKYSYATFDNFPYDSAGVVVDGQYTQFQQTPPTQETTPSPYMTVSDIELAPGTHQLGFVAYNTSDIFASTNIYITDIEFAETPEPATWVMLMAGCLGVAAFLRRAPALRV